MSTISEAGQMATQLEPFVHQRTILLHTRRRDGSWVGTPVSIAVQADHAYIRTYAKAGKPKRIRNFPEVRFSPATFRGRPTGPELRAEARLLDGDEAAAAARLLRRKYPLLHGLAVPLAHRLMRTSTLHYELSGVRPGTGQHAA